jgi:hypothetical protein
LHRTTATISSFGFTVLQETPFTQTNSRSFPACSQLEAQSLQLSRTIFVSIVLPFSVAAKIIIVCRKRGVPTATITPLVFWVSVFTVLAMHNLFIPKLHGHSLKLAAGGAVNRWLSGNQFAEHVLEPVRKNRSAAYDLYQMVSVNQAHGLFLLRI